MAALTNFVSGNFCSKTVWRAWSPSFSEPASHQVTTSTSLASPSHGLALLSEPPPDSLPDEEASPEPPEEHAAIDSASTATPTHAITLRI